MGITHSYMRRDIFEQEEDEQEHVITTNCLRQSDLDSIFSENKNKEASIQEEYQTLLQLRSDLSKGPCRSRFAGRSRAR